jgi:ABC-type transport system substrate-binding protein
MKSNKKILAIVLVVTMALSLLAGCGVKTDPSTAPSVNPSSNAPASEAPPATPTGPQELVMGVGVDIGSMWPFGAPISGVKAKLELVYEPLFWMDTEGELQPILAKSYESLGDGKYSIEIFDNIQDSEGNHLTAADIAFTLEKYIPNSGNAATVATIKDYGATGDYTFELTFSPESPGQFVNLMCQMHCVTQASWEASGDDMSAYPVGTGGYVLDKAKTVLGSTYVFTKRDGYWQTDEEYICDRNTHNLDNLTLKIITDSSAL